MTSRLTPTTLLTALAVAASCACSSPTDSNPSDAGGSSGGSGTTAGDNTGGLAGATAGAGGTTTPAGAGSGGASAAGGAAHSGQVALFNLLAEKYRDLTVSFVQSSTPGTKTCDTSSAGSCRVSICPGDLGGSAQPASAGVVTVTSPEVMGSGTISPAADGSYSMPVFDFAQLFSGQEHINFKAAGDVVPAFESELDMPLVLLLSAPLFVKGTPGIDAPRDQDLSLTWTRGAEGELFYLNGASARPDGLPGSVGLICQFPSTPGSGTISATLLQKLAPDSQLSLFTTNSKQITAGDYAVTLVNVISVANPDKVVIPHIHLL